MSGDQEARGRLHAVVRGALIAAAVGGALFVVSQLASHDSASAESVRSVESARVSESPTPGQGLLGGTIASLGSTLGQLTGTVASTAHDATGLVQNTTSSVTSVLPKNAQQGLNDITHPVTDALSGVRAAAPVSSTVTAVAANVDRLTGQLPIVSGLIGPSPASSLMDPAAAQVDNAIGSTLGSVDGIITSTPDPSAPSLPGLTPLPSLPDLPGFPGLTAPGSGGGTVAIPVDTNGDGIPDGTITVPAGSLAAALGPDGTGDALSAADVRALIAAGERAPSAVFAAAGALGDGPGGLPVPTLPSPIGGDNAVISGSGSGASGSSRGAPGDGSPLAEALGSYHFPAAAAGANNGSQDDELPLAAVFDTDTSPD